MHFNQLLPIFHTGPHYRSNACEGAVSAGVATTFYTKDVPITTLETSAPNSSPAFENGALVLYRSRPARITGFTGQKIGIETVDGTAVMVRPSDILLLFAGPAGNLRSLPAQPLPAPLEETCELLGDESSCLHDLAELLYETCTAATVWSTYLLLADGVYFTGTIDRIVPRPHDEVERELARRSAAAAERSAWTAFIDEVRSGTVSPANRHRLASVEELAFGKTANSAVLKELSIAPTSENAHKLLLRLGHWDEFVNPYPQRMQVTFSGSYPPVDPLREEARLDLTHLPAYAIDDEGNRDPDDAISIDGDKLWVHIADVASIVTPDSAADLHARTYGATHYLPEHTTTMLAPEMTAQLGLGLQPVSPALSFCLTVGSDGAVAGVEVHLTRIAVTRLTYEEAELRMHEPFFADVAAVCSRYRAKRVANHAVMITFPEVRIRVVDSIVSIKPLPDTLSRQLVAETMMMAGEAAARFSLEHRIPFPYTVQPPPEVYEQPTTLSGMFSYRKKLKPSQIQSTPAPHAGLGVDVYSRATSPLRRYIDLVAHQQLRAFLLEGEVMDEQTITNRIGAYNAVIGSVGKLERLSNQHWTLVYLQQHKGWSGKGIIVDKTERNATVLMPELAFETRMPSVKSMPLDSEIQVTAGSVELTELSVHFRVE